MLIFAKSFLFYLSGGRSLSTALSQTARASSTGAGQNKRPSPHPTASRWTRLPPSACSRASRTTSWPSRLAYEHPDRDRMAVPGDSPDDPAGEGHRAGAGTALLLGSSPAYDSSADLRFPRTWPPSPDDGKELHQRASGDDTAMRCHRPNDTMTFFGLLTFGPSARIWRSLGWRTGINSIYILGIPGSNTGIVTRPQTDRLIQ